MSKEVCASMELVLNADGTLDVSMNGTRAYLTHLLSLGSVEALRRIIGCHPTDEALLGWIGLMQEARDMIRCHGDPHVDARMMAGIGTIDIVLAAEEKG